MKTSASYVRVSTDMQLEFSLDSQLKLIRKYAESNNIELLEEHIYKDEGISGTNASNRPQFQKMISVAKSKEKPFDIILVYDFSRFARNREESIVYKRLLKKKGIQVISITQPLTDDKNSVIFEAMFEAMDEYYSLNLSDNVKRGLYEKASRGEFRGNAPFGYVYNKNTKSLDIDEEKAKIVHIIFDDYVTNHNVINIVKKLNGCGIKTMYGKLWTQIQIRNILHNPIYIGKVKYVESGYKSKHFATNIELFNGLHKAIIDKDTYNKAKELLLKSKTLYSNIRSSTTYRHWLSGLIKCAYCGNSLVYDRRTVNFRCSGYNKGQCSHSGYIKEYKIIELVLNKLKEHFTDKIDINISNYDSSLKNEIELINLELKKIETKKDRIKIGYEEGIYEIKEYKDKIVKTDLKIKELNKKLKENKKDKRLEEKKGEIFVASENAYKLLTNKKTPNDIKFIITHELVEKIVFDKENRELTIYYN